MGSTYRAMLVRPKSSSIRNQGKSDDDTCLVPPRDRSCPPKSITHDDKHSGSFVSGNSNGEEETKVLRRLLLST